MKYLMIEWVTPIILFIVFWGPIWYTNKEVDNLYGFSIFHIIGWIWSCQILGKLCDKISYWAWGYDKDDHKS